MPTHHLAGHIAANYIAHPELKPPYLCLVVSGGHSHLVEVLTYTKFRILGRTRDDAAGECFDKCARAMGYPYPGGIHLDKASQSGNPKAFSLPKPKIAENAYDFSFSGLKNCRGEPAAQCPAERRNHLSGRSGGFGAGDYFRGADRTHPFGRQWNTAIPPLPLPAAFLPTAAWRESLQKSLRQAELHPVHAAAFPVR